MPSIAIFPCNFTPAARIVEDLSTALGLKVYTDHNLIADTTTRFGMNTEKLKKAIFDKTSVFNQFTLERETAISMLRVVLLEKLKSGDNYLFNGFMTSLVSPQNTHVLKVLVVDNKQVRITRAVKDGTSQKDAQKMIKNHDFSAFTWTDFLFKKEAYDSALYDLVIPAEKKTHQELADEISRNFHKTAVLHTSDINRTVGDLLIAAEVELLLLNNGHKAPVKVENGDVTIYVPNRIFSFNLEEELSALGKQIAGVNQVEIAKSTVDSDPIYRRQKFELPSKVLFVDDEKDFVQTVSQRLISRDVGTYGVFNGTDALELIAEDRPDVMVLDLKMPGLYGVEVLRRAKELAPEIEVIILTGHGSAQDMQECMELGAYAYLNKPVNIEELSETIKAANEKVHSKIKK